MNNLSETRCVVPISGEPSAGEIIISAECNVTAGAWISEWLTLLHLLCSLTADNGLNPTWVNNTFRFHVRNSSFAFLRFGVHEIDIFNDQNFLAQATLPIQGLKTGTCSTPLLSRLDVISYKWVLCFICFHRLPVSTAEEQLQWRSGVGFSVGPHENHQMWGGLVLFKLSWFKICSL